jgi:hypothetical protein
MLTKLKISLRNKGIYLEKLELLQNIFEVGIYYRHTPYGKFIAFNLGHFRIILWLKQYGN